MPLLTATRPHSCWYTALQTILSIQLKRSNSGRRSTKPAPIRAGLLSLAPGISSPRIRSRSLPASAGSRPRAFCASCRGSSDIEPPRKHGHHTAKLRLGREDQDHSCRNRVDPDKSLLDALSSNLRSVSDGPSQIPHLNSIHCEHGRSVARYHGVTLERRRIHADAESADC